MFYLYHTFPFALIYLKALMDVQTAMVVAATSVSQQLAVVKNVYALQVSVYKQME